MYKKILNENQSLLIPAYKEYLENIQDFKIETIEHFDGYICRKNRNEKLDNEFHIKGKYYGFYGSEFKDYLKTEFDEYLYIQNKKVLIIENMKYKGFHYHFSVIMKILKDLSIENNKLYYQHDLINTNIINHINTIVTNGYKQIDQFYGIFENYGKTNNFILI